MPITIDTAFLETMPANVAVQFFDRVSASPDSEAFRFPRGDAWESVTWKQAGDKVEALAAGLDASFARIQCTPDLMPSDMTGTQVFRPDDGRFDFIPGPLFHSLVLVDEINRAPARVQSALLEATEEGAVTVDGSTRELPSPFLLVATQNPVEMTGTYPLGEGALVHAR